MKTPYQSRLRYCKGRWISHCPDTTLGPQYATQSVSAILELDSFSSQLKAKSQKLWHLPKTKPIRMPGYAFFGTAQGILDEVETAKRTANK